MKSDVPTKNVHSNFIFNSPKLESAIFKLLNVWVLSPVVLAIEIRRIARSSKPAQEKSSSDPITKQGWQRCSSDRAPS
jgi:hypothetical protein